MWAQAGEADNLHYEALEKHFIEAFKDCEKITGRHYEIYEYYGAADATECIIIMGSGCITVRETVDYLN